MFSRQSIRGGRSRHDVLGRKVALGALGSLWVPCRACCKSQGVPICCLLGALSGVYLAPPQSSTYLWSSPKRTCRAHKRSTCPPPSRRAGAGLCPELTGPSPLSDNEWALALPSYMPSPTLLHAKSRPACLLCFTAVVSLMWSGPLSLSIF